MKKQLFSFVTALLGFGLLNATAQFGGGGHPAGPSFGDAMAKLFGEHQSFSAAMELETGTPGSEKAISMPCKMSFDHGRSCLEMNMGEMKGGSMPPGAAVQMKAMGMDKMVSISRPDKKVMYLIYPGMQGYVETPLKDSAEVAASDDFKVETTELGKETVDGHDCVKNKVVVTDKNGKTTESTVWNAKDLRKFPVKIETAEHGQKAVMHFKDVVFSQPESSIFEVPTGMTKHASMQAMMQEVMMKRMGGAMRQP